MGAVQRKLLLVWACADSHRGDQGNTVRAAWYIALRAESTHTHTTDVTKVIFIKCLNHPFL